MRELLTVKNNVDRVLAMEQAEPATERKRPRPAVSWSRSKAFAQNAQPQIENLCSKGAWGTSLNKRVGLYG